MMRTKDALWIGVLIGLAAPSLGIFIFYLLNFSHESLGTFLTISISQRILSPLLSLCAVVNLGVFFLFMHFEHYQTARGIILATLVYGVAIVVLKFML